MLLGQFSYATVPEPGPHSDADGWKVQQVVPADIDRGRVEAATGALGSFPPASVPLLAGAELLDALPRRLRLQVYPDRSAVLLHQVSAGQSHRHRDASYTHALLVRVADGQGLGDVRPAELWGSPIWLRPVGAEAVSAARLDPELDLPVPSPADVDGTWLDEPELALFLLAVLDHGLAGRSPGRVALVDPAGGLTARWVAFCSRYLTPGAAWTQLPFSTHERSIEANAASLAELRIIGLPPEEFDGARRSLGPEWVLVDPAAVPTRDDAGWTVPDGRVVPLGRWAQLAESLSTLPLLEMPSGPELLTAAAADWAGSADDQPRWGLPAALLSGPDEVLSAMREVAKGAADLAAVTWPAAVRMPAARQQRLLASFTRFAADPGAAFGAILRAADRPGVPAGSLDLLLDGYLRSLWDPDRSGWTRETGPLPWSPETLAPGAELADALLADLAGLVGWVARDGVDPVVRVRVLSTVVGPAARWGWLDRPELADPVRVLLDAQLGTLVVGRAPVDGTWPLLPPPVLSVLLARLTDLIRRDPGGFRLPPAASPWLDATLGPLDARRPLRTFSPLDLERAVPGPPGDPGNAAVVVRDALAQVPGQEWPAGGWLDTLQRGGVPIVPAALREVVEACLTFGIPIPAAGIGELFLSGQPLSPAAQDFAAWLLRVAPDAGSARVVALHAACRPQPWEPGRLLAAPGFVPELRTLSSVGLQPTGALGESARHRLARDLLALDARDAADTDWARFLGLADVTAALRPRWSAAYQELSRTAAPGRRGLAASLLARALLDNEAELSAAPIRAAHQDPAGRFLRHRPDPQTEDWLVETWVRELLADSDRGAKQQWVADVRRQAAEAADLLLTRIRVRPQAQDVFRENLLAMVDDNAGKIALGTFGSMLGLHKRR